MSVPPEMMKLIAGGAGKNPGAGPEPMGGGGGPSGAPMTTPQPNEGEQQAAAINITMAMDLLEKALPAFGSESEEGKSILSSLSGLSRKFGDKRDKAKELVPAELQILMQQAGKMSPESSAMGAGGAPGAAPPMAA